MYSDEFRAKVCLSFHVFCLMSTPGFLLVNKPSGPTSHDMVDQFRRLTGEKTIGHAGTLDPFATGLLILGMGKEATRRMLALTHLDKWYEAEIELGVETDTYDRTGKVVKELRIKNYELGELKKIVSNFLGPQEQIPPMFSAKKIAGKKLYELARQGKEVERPTAQVSFYRLEIINPPPNLPLCERGRKFLPSAKQGGDEEGGHGLQATCYALHVLVRCSTGTYIRALAHDLGQKLGCGAHLKELKRLAVGPFSLEQAHPDKILPIPEVLAILNAYKQNPINVLVSNPPPQSSPSSEREENVSPLSSGGGDKEGGHAKKVLVFGTFDPLHDGHHFFLTEAKKYGDHLTVIVTRDQHIKHFKQREPHQSEVERLSVIRALPCVNEARLSDEHLDWVGLKEINPDLIILGHDQQALKNALPARLPTVQLRQMIY